jgi:2-methylaconitate cis-trans-isomerase PrpF
VAGSVEEALGKSAIPFIGFVAPAADATTLSGDAVHASEVDFVARVLSNGQAHRALPLGVSMCLAAAGRIEGTVVHDAMRSGRAEDAGIRIGMPSGVLTVAAEVRREGAGWRALRGGFYRTQRRLFDGHVYVPASAAAVPQTC